MSEDTQVVEEVVAPEATDEAEVNTEQVSAPEHSEIELKAIEMGWRPKEEFDGDDAEFIDATEFVRRKPLFDKIESVGKELRETRKAMKALQEHHAKVQEAEYKHAVEQLKAEKKAALESGDADRLIEIDSQMAEVKANEVMAQQQAQQAKNTLHPNFVEWVGKNKWYQSNGEMRAFADQVGTSYAAANPNTDPDDVLKYVEQRVKKVYSEAFSNPNKTRPSAVEGGSNAPSRSTTVRDTFQLSEDEKRVMNTFVRQGIMSKEQYVEELKKVRGA